MLSIFSTGLLFKDIIVKSAMGYFVAFTSAYFIWLMAEYILKKYDYKAKQGTHRDQIRWRIAQTCTTVLLFSTWLMHDMVNIAVFLPRGLEDMGSIGLYIMFTISGLFALALAYTFYING